MPTNWIFQFGWREGTSRLLTISISATAFERTDKYTDSQIYIFLKFGCFAQLAFVNSLTVHQYNHHWLLKDWKLGHLLLLNVLQATSDRILTIETV